MRAFYIRHFCKSLFFNSYQQSFWHLALIHVYAQINTVHWSTSTEVTLHFFATQTYLKCSHTTAYGISVCQRLIIRSHTQIYVRGTLAYVGVRCYTQRLNYFFGHVQKILAYASVQIIRYSYAHHTLGIRWIRQAYAEYARHTLEVRYSYVGTNVGQLCSEYVYRVLFSPLSSVVERSSSPAPFFI